MNEAFLVENYNRNEVYKNNDINFHKRNILDGFVGMKKFTNFNELILDLKKYNFLIEFEDETKECYTFKELVKTIRNSNSYEIELFEHTIDILFHSEGLDISQVSIHDGAEMWIFFYDKVDYMHVMESDSWIFEYYLEFHASSNAYTIKCDSFEEMIKQLKKYSFIESNLKINSIDDFNQLEDEFDINVEVKDRVKLIPKEKCIFNNISILKEVFYIFIETFHILPRDLEMWENNWKVTYGSFNNIYSATFSSVEEAIKTINAEIPNVNLNHATNFKELFNENLEKSLGENFNPGYLWFITKTGSIVFIKAENLIYVEVRLRKPIFSSIFVTIQHKI